MSSIEFKGQIPQHGYDAAKEFTENMHQFGFNRGIGGQKSAFLAGYKSAFDHHSRPIKEPVVEMEKSHGFYCHDLDHGICDEKCISQCEDCADPSPSIQQEKERIHVQLPSGAVANVSPDASPELLNALDTMVELAKETVSDWDVQQEAIPDQPSGQLEKESSPLAKEAFARSMHSLEKTLNAQLVLSVLKWALDNHVSRAGKYWGKDYSNIAYDDEGIVREYLKSLTTNTQDK